MNKQNFLNVLIIIAFLSFIPPLAINQVNAVSYDSVTVNSASVSVTGSSFYFGLPITMTGSGSVTWTHNNNNNPCILDGSGCQVEVTGTLYYEQSGATSYSSIGLGMLTGHNGLYTYTFSSVNIGPFSSGSATVYYYVEVTATIYYPYPTNIYGSNSTTSSTYSLTLQTDSTAPTISGVTINPSSPTNYDNVNVTATIADSGTGVDSYYLEYVVNTVLPYKNVTFTRISGNSASGTYKGTIPSQLVSSLIDYTIGANDVLGNKNTYPGSYTVGRDTIPPTISNVYNSPANGAINDTTLVTVYATLNDNYYLSTTQITSYFYNAVWTNVSMTSTGSGNVWKSSAIGTFSKGTTVQYKIYCEDLSGNWATSSIYSFYVNDSDVFPPTIDNPNYPKSPTENTDMNISVNVTDISGIASVTLYYSPDNVSFTPYSMIFDTGNTFSYDLGYFTKGTQFYFYINATDKSLNSNVGTNNNGGLNYVVFIGDSDTTPPTISNPNLNPQVPGYNDIITISASVSDSGSGVKNVSLYYEVNISGNWISVPMNNNSGIYSYSLGKLAFSTNISYYIVSFDTSLNQNKAVNDNGGNYYSFEVTDNVAPLLTMSSNLSYEMGSNNHYIYWNATDLNPGSFSLLRNGTQVATGSWTNSQQYSFKVDGLSVGVYNFTVKVLDSFSNYKTGLVQVTVVDTTSPIISHPSDVTTTQGANINISWFLSDLNPGKYNILVDGIQTISQANWPSNNIVDYNVASLAVGTHNVTIVAFDNYGNIVSDQVSVTVSANTNTSTPTTTSSQQSTSTSLQQTSTSPSTSSSNPSSPGFEYIIAIIGLFGISLLFRKRKNRGN